MKKLLLAFIGCWLLCLGLGAQAAGVTSSVAGLTDQMRSEQKHFMECLACVYSPGWWVSYNDGLYFRSRDEAQDQQLEEMVAARAKYVALTNRQARYDLALALIVGSGVGDEWQRKLLLPFSATNQNLTPTLDKPLRIVPKYTVLQSLSNGDALIQDEATTLFVMNFGRGAGGASGTNALLVREGTKTYVSGGAFKTVAAFTDVALSKEETAMLNRVAAACQKQAAALGQRDNSAKDIDDFEACKARATDSNPYMEYLLAKAYLEGKGTEKDEKLGLEWMRRAAQSGSGDATAYLEALAPKPR
jgi:TPR repeat protein